LPLQLKTEPLPRSNLKAEDVRSQLVGGLHFGIM
jgi:hypothetical protein